MSEQKNEEQGGKPWGLILITAFFVLSLLGPVLLQLVQKK